MHIFELFFHKRKGYFVPLAFCLLSQGCVQSHQNSNPQTTERVRPEPTNTHHSEISQLLSGILLTSSERSVEEVLEGRRILQLILESEGNSGTAPHLRTLARARLEILDSQEGLTRQLEATEMKLENTEKKLENAEKKIRELLEIESSIESNRQQSEGSPP